MVNIPLHREGLSRNTATGGDTPSEFIEFLTFEDPRKPHRVSRTPVPEGRRSPAYLLNLVKRTEKAVFRAILFSDHFNPRTPSPGGGRVCVVVARRGAPGDRSSGRGDMCARLPSPPGYPRTGAATLVVTDLMPRSGSIRGRGGSFVPPELDRQDFEKNSSLPLDIIT